MACGDNKSIAYISGNFSVVHPGHLRLLKFAAEHADVLVVGVNSDKVTGVTLPQDMRLENVRSISMADHAVGLDVPADTFIAALKPNVVVKGKGVRDALQFGTGSGGLLWRSARFQFRRIALCIAVVAGAGPY